MSARPVTARTPRARDDARRARSRASARTRRRQVLRRRLFLLAAVGILGVVVAMVASPWADKAVQELQLPLRHEDIIRQQAHDKGLDPSLIAGVIYVESHFVDQTSHAGAKGLMQLMPQTADYIARKSGGTRFVQGDLATPQVNIAYGSWYLRYLLRKYDGNEPLALAAYNAGEGKVDEWWRAAAARGEHFDVATHIPFAETRNYVARVLEARQQYRKHYAHELGL
jgi:soluble lytic murein transglycosylase